MPEIIAWYRPLQQVCEAESAVNIQPRDPSRDTENSKTWLKERGECRPHMFLCCLRDAAKLYRAQAWVLVGSYGPSSNKKSRPPVHVGVGAAFFLLPFEKHLVTPTP